MSFLFGKVVLMGYYIISKKQIVHAPSLVVWHLGNYTNNKSICCVQMVYSRLTIMFAVPKFLHKLYITGEN